MKLSTSFAFKQLGKPLEKSWLKSYTYKQDARANKCSLRMKNGQPYFVFSGTWLESCKNEDGTFSNPPKQFDDEMVKLRYKRNQLLQQTDWMGYSDVQMSTEWQTYRQSLRDITNGLTTVADIEAVTWPTKPN